MESRGKPGPFVMNTYFHADVTGRAQAADGGIAPGAGDWRGRTEPTVEARSAQPFRRVQAFATAKTDGTQGKKGSREKPARYTKAGCAV